LQQAEVKKKAIKELDPTDLQVNGCYAAILEANVVD